jgi:hypothetical protein
MVGRIGEEDAARRGSAAVSADGIDPESGGGVMQSVSACPWLPPDLITVTMHQLDRVGFWVEEEL